MATASKANAKVAAADDGAGSGAAAKGSKKKLIIIIVGALLLAAIGAGAAWFFMGKAQGGQDGHATAAPPPPKVDLSKPPVFLQMEPFTVNLQPENGEQYLQVAFTLQVADQSQVDYLKMYMPLLRSRILLLLASRKASEIGTAEGKQKLQTDILAEVTKPFVPNAPPQSASGVFFTSFVIQ